ncbi:CAP domain-containing protein [Jidongwangia harbinensis]|uniref:CAP domain-containing protein n=1 Tax=Jidongwangia harbinensis TaxID=2878561 RepID=UPI001CD941FF|nr:CAP domain-containing protein [Jidongwangia harbinensis]MCA2213679.1 CAP domain-containing protein [Jidongwangia harbinensis]
MGRLAVLATVPALLAVAAPAQAAVPAGAAAAVVVPAGPPTEAELMSLIVTQTNQRRHAAGCGQVAVDHQLVEASVQQSTYMAVTGTFGHFGRGGSTFVTRARAAGYTHPAGENIGWGYPTATAIMDAWMASPAHRANILNCAARSIGTGVRYAANGTPYYTQLFGWS